MRRFLVLSVSHALVLLAGFALGVYALPILTAPAGPDRAAIDSATAAPLFTARFDHNLKGSDFLHWGEGEVRISRTHVAHIGRLAPGPDYRVYLAPEFVDTKEDFLRIKAQSRQVGEVKTFGGIATRNPSNVDPAAYTTVVVWCETFRQFISAAKYR